MPVPTLEAGGGEGSARFMSKTKRPIEFDAIPGDFTHWGGGENPLPSYVLCEVVFRLKNRLSHRPRLSAIWHWKHATEPKYSGGDIIAYRAVN